MTMMDRQTNSMWYHLDGKAVNGALKGVQMKFVMLLHTTWDEWRALYPNSVVLSNDTSFRAQYRHDNIGAPNPGIAREIMNLDARLKPEELVLGIFAGGQYNAYPLSTLKQTSGVVNDTLGGIPIVVFYDAKANSAAAFSRSVNGMEARFEAASGAKFAARDNLANLTWDLSGRASTGAQLEFVTSYLSEWYGWSAYHPATGIYAAK